MISNRQIQSMLAKAITDVKYIRYLEKSKRGGAVLLSSMQKGNKRPDLSGILNFSAFISKVQHNFLWNDFPETFDLIHKQFLEINIFSAYLPAHQENKRQRLSFDEKTERFATFLESYLSNRRSGRFRLLYYVFKHENQIFRLKQKAKQLVKGRTGASPGNLLPQSLLHINGEIHLHRFPVSPKTLAHHTDGKKRLPDLKTAVWYAYWLNPETKTVETIAVSKEANILISYVNGHNSLENVMRKASNRMGEKNASSMLLFLIKNRIILIK